MKAGEWLIAKDPMLLGSDNTPVEVAPPADPMLSGPIHQMALVALDRRHQQTLRSLGADTRLGISRTVQERLREVDANQQ